MKIQIEQISHHRNGISGESFHAVLFTSDENTNADNSPRRMVASVFEAPGHVSVLDIAMLTYTVEFGTNSWRGDCFEAQLREAIAAYETERASKEVA